MRKITIDFYDGEDGWLVAEVVELPGIVSQGKSFLEALRNIGEAISAAATVRMEMESDL